jgi:predicted nuclease of restriction endonuclease-like (RecB) superfamily
MRFERAAISEKKSENLPIKQEINERFLDFLNLPENHHESTLQKAIIANMKKFLLEIGKDFSFIGEGCLGQKRRPRAVFLVPDRPPIITLSIHFCLGKVF